MPIPDYQTLMLPLLRFLKDNNEHNIKEAIDHLSAEFKLSEEEKMQILNSGQRIINNRVGWARTYMVKAGLIEPTRRGFIKITQIGIEVLTENPGKIDTKFLEGFGG